MSLEAGGGEHRILCSTMGRGSTEYCVVLGVRRKTGDSGQDSREDTKEEWDDRTGDAVTRTQRHTGRNADNCREDEGLGKNTRL